MGGRGLLIVCTAAVTVVAPLLLPMTAYYLNLLMQATTYEVAVVGLTIVLGYNGQINLASLLLVPRRPSSVTSAKTASINNAGAGPAWPAIRWATSSVPPLSR